MTAAPVRLTSFCSSAETAVKWPADSEDLPWSRQLKVLSSEVDDEQKQEVLSNMNTQRLCFTCLVSQKHFRCVSHFLELLRTSGQREKPSARLVPSIGSSEWRETLFVPATIDNCALTISPRSQRRTGNLDVVTACGQGPAIADFFILAASYAVIAGPEQDEIVRGADGIWLAYPEMTRNGIVVATPASFPMREGLSGRVDVLVGFPQILQISDLRSVWASFLALTYAGQDKNCPATVRSSDDDGCRFYAFPEWKFTRDEGPPRPTCWSMSGRGCTVGILSGASDVPVLPVFSQETAADNFLPSSSRPVIGRRAPPVDVQDHRKGHFSSCRTVLCDIVSGFLWADPPLQSGSCNGIEYNSFSNLNGGARRRMDVGKNRAFLDRDLLIQQNHQSRASLRGVREVGHNYAGSFGEWHEKSAVSTGVSLDDDARQPASLGWRATLRISSGRPNRQEWISVACLRAQTCPVFPTLPDAARIWKEETPKVHNVQAVEGR
ncbi:hypothetical protein R3P38DRAFT_2799401 [Favolaschia claudopus]|uniref:Uncharacterized protein n=1 Tax=Favolaschia claudopus TaxID=2862362 RepID=A0AAW0A0J9_9AGAR